MEPRARDANETHKSAQERMREADSRISSPAMKASTRLFAACACSAGAAFLFACSIDPAGSDLFADGPAADSGLDAVTTYHEDVSAPPPDAAHGDATIGGGHDEDAGDASDGKADAAHDAAPAVDSAPPPPPAQIQCGGGIFNQVECDGATETCCASGTSAGFSYTCIPHGSACSGIAIACANTSDCSNGDVCCDHHGQTEQVMCMTDAACGSELRLCDPFGADCPLGKVCLPYGNNIPYYVCH